MFKSLIQIGLPIAVAVACQATATHAQDYPTKVIRLVVGGAGGGNDFASRIISNEISAPLGQRVIVENRPSGLNAIETVLRAPPDGYTLLFTASYFWIGPLIRPQTNYDAMRDFVPITLVSFTPNVLVVHPALPVKTVKDLIALAKRRPGALNYSMGSVGSSAHLAAELFEAMAGVDMVRIPFTSASLRMTALMSGDVQLEFATGGSVAPHLKSGRLRALAVTTAEPSPLAPGLPTLSSAGVPGYESVNMSGVFAPAKTPLAIVNRVNQEMVKVLVRPDIQQKFFASGVETAGTTPDAFAAKIKSEVARMGKVIKAAGLTSD